MALQAADQSYVAEVQQGRASAGQAIGATAKTAAQLLVQYMAHCTGVLSNRSATSQPQPQPQSQPQPQQAGYSRAGAGRGRGRGQSLPPTRSAISAAPATATRPVESAPMATRNVTINRGSGGLGIILQTTHSGDPIVESAQGAAAQAGVVAGCQILTCCGVSMRGQGEGAVVAVIKRQAAGSPIQMTLQAPMHNWPASIRRK